MLPVETPFKIYTGLTGQPLNNGYVYFGVANQNPITAPITVYWDAAGTQPAAQPLRTVNGYIMRSGTPANVFVNISYSELVKDSTGQQVFYARNSDDFSIGTLLAASDGSAMIGFIQAGSDTVAITVQDKLREIVNRVEYTSDAAFDTARVGKPNIEGTIFAAPLMTVGEGDRFVTATKDGLVVAQVINGATNCHAVADQTIIESVSDAGTYGAFDSTVELQGTHNQNHVYSFQDRARYAGGVGGVLQNSAGFISQSVHSGAGIVTSRIGMMIDEMAITGAGSIASQIGILINPQTSGANNVGLNIGQTTGWAMYAGGGAKSYHGGQLGLGAEPIAGAKLYIEPNAFGSLAVGVRIVQPNAWTVYATGAGKFYHQSAAGFGVEPSIGAIDFAGSGGVTGFLTTDASSITFGASGDRSMKWVTGADVRLQLDATTYTFKPWGDNTQKLGDAAFRWSTVYAGTGAINTSDAREKQQAKAIEAAVMRAAKKINFRQFKFNDAVAAKGDSARWHFGVIAQDVKAAFESEGLDPFAYGLLCYDVWEAGDGHQAGSRYGVRYDELLVLQCACMQARLTALESKP